MSLFWRAAARQPGALSLFLARRRPPTRRAESFFGAPPPANPARFVFFGRAAARQPGALSLFLARRRPPTPRDIRAKFVLISQRIGRAKVGSGFYFKNAGAWRGAVAARGLLKRGGRDGWCGGLLWPGFARRCWEGLGRWIWRFWAEDFWDGLDPEYPANGTQDFADLRALREERGDFWIGQVLLQLFGENGCFGQILRKPTEAARQHNI